MLSGDTPANARQRAFVKECLYSPAEGLNEVRRFYEAVTDQFIRQHSRKIGNVCQVDIVRE